MCVGLSQFSKVGLAHASSSLTLSSKIRDQYRGRRVTLYGAVDDHSKKKLPFFLCAAKRLFVQRLNMVEF